MNFYETIFSYGSPVIATLACLLNLPEIFLLIARYRKITKSPCERRTVPVILLASLSVSDFLVGLTVILVKILRFFLVKDIIPTTYTSVRLYKVLNFLFLRLSLLTSIFSLLALTLDRFLAIAKPLIYRSRIQAKHGFAAVISTWTCSSAIIGIHYYLSIFNDIEELKYRLLIFPITIIPACITFSFLYLMILRRIHIHGQNTRQNIALDAEHYSRYILEREMKVSRFAAMVVLLFVICWLPLAITGVVSTVGVHVEPSLPNLMFLFAFVNSTLNPLIYFAFKEKASGRRMRHSFCLCQVSQSDNTVLSAPVRINTL